MLMDYRIGGQKVLQIAFNGQQVKERTPTVSWSLICSIFHSYQRWIMCLFVYVCSCCKLLSLFSVGSLFVAIALLSFKRRMFSIVSRENDFSLRLQASAQSCFLHFFIKPLFLKLPSMCCNLVSVPRASAFSFDMSPYNINKAQCAL